MVLPDVNLLIYAVAERSDQHRAARQWWEQQLNGAETVALPWAVAVSFLRLITNPRVMSVALTFDQASTLLDDWYGLPAVTTVAPTQRHAAVMRDLLGGLGTAGNLVPDAHIAALAIEHGAVLCSADNDFSRFPGLRWNNPIS
jgi:toxin-antitoxin system PIN domain toxin